MSRGATIKSLNSVSQSAKQAGLGDKPADSVLYTCPHQSGHKKGDKAKPLESKPLEYCDIRQLQLVLATDGKSQTFTVPRERRSEDFPRDRVAQEYHSALVTHDIVIEALSDVEDTTGSERKTSKDKKPLDVQATATNTVSHFSFTPAHPHCKLDLNSYDSVESDGGRPVAARYFAPAGGWMSRTTWGAMWPFGDNRVRSYDAVAHACGVLPIPQRTNEDLSARIVVFPYEEWAITIGLRGTKEESYSKEYNRLAPKDGKSERRVSTTVTVKKRKGSVETSTKTEKMSTPAGHGRTRVTETKAELKYTLLGTNSEAASVLKQSWDKRPRTKEDDDTDYRKVSIKRSIAGRETEVDVSATIKNILEIKKIFDDASKLFSSVKIGWSVSMSYELFGGKIFFGWGNRWPVSYREQHRVWYIERFIKAGGSLDVVKGSIGGFFGFAVDPWYAPVAVEIGAYLTATLKVTIAPEVDYAYTNSAAKMENLKGSLSPSAKIGFEAGGKANGRAFGYSVESKLALESEASITFQGGISTKNPPYLKGSLILGKPHEGGGKDAPKAAAIRLIGEMICTGETVRRWEIDPVVLAKGMEVFKDKYFWGEAPKEG